MDTKPFAENERNYILDNLIFEETPYSDTDMSEQTDTLDLRLPEETDIGDQPADEVKSRAAKKDRSGGKYSEEAFLALPRTEQLTLAEK